MVYQFITIISSPQDIFLQSQSHNNINIFILQVTSFFSGLEPSSGLIQEQRYRKL